MTKRRLLITAGNTWAPLDDVRVLTNVFSGETGLRIAKACAKRGFEVTIILADCRADISKFQHKRIRVIRAIPFDEFYKAVKREVKSGRYLALIHAAAISDFILKKPRKGKISSKKKLKLSLSLAPKIADKIKKWDEQIKLIKFKLESRVKPKKLIKIALRSKADSEANLIVANKLPFKKKHAFLLIKSKTQIKQVNGKAQLAKRLARILDKELP